MPSSSSKSVRAAAGLVCGVFAAFVFFHLLWAVGLTSTLEAMYPEGPTDASIVTSAPRRAHATAWFAPLPPGTRENDPPPTVPPGFGSRSIRTTRSRLTDPTTTIRGFTRCCPIGTG